METGSRSLFETILPVFASEVKVKVKLSLCPTKYHAMKTCWGVEV
jgi:hypothetical protein